MPSSQKRIGLMLDLTDSYDLEVAKGVLHFAKGRADWRLFCQTWLSNPAEDPQSWSGDGIITRIFDLHMYRRNTPPGTMVVDVAGTEENPPYAQVTNNDELAGYLAGKHLARCGLEHIAFLGVAGDGWSEKRRDGVERAAREAGRPAVHRREVPDRWIWSPEKFADLKLWLGELPKPCGLAITDDAMSLKAMRAIAEAGLAIPGELAVVVVGNEEALFALAEPTLTSIVCDCRRIGYEAARRLDRMLETGETAPEPLYIHPRPLVPRESTALTPADASVTAALDVIRARAHRGIEAGEVAKRVGVGLRNLDARFKALVGHSVADELAQLRLGAARRLLEGGSTAAVASRRSGHADVKRFAAAFKREFGATPEDYAASRRDPVNPAS